MELAEGASIVGVQGPRDVTIVTYDDGPKPGDTDAILRRWTTVGPPRRSSSC